MSKNQKGFSVIEGLLILVIISMIGGVGYFVYGSQKATDKSLDNASKSSATNPTSKTSKDKAIRTVLTLHTISYDGASYSVQVPKGWLFTDSGYSAMSDYYAVSIADPNEKYSLDLYIQPIADQEQYSGNKLDNPTIFKGIGDKTFAYEAVETNSSTPKINQLSISACPATYCFTKLSDKYALSMAIDINKADTISLSDPLVAQYVRVINTIKVLSQ